MQRIHAASGPSRREVVPKSTSPVLCDSPVAWSAASTADSSVSPASTVDIPCSTTTTIQCQAADQRNLSKQSSMNSNRTEVIIPPRSSVSAIASLFSQKLESNMAQENSGLQSRSSMRRERSTGEASTLTSTSALSSRPASRAQRGVVECSTKEHYSDAARAPVVDHNATAAAAPSKASSAPEGMRANDRRNTHPDPRTGGEETRHPSQSGTALSEDKKIRRSSAPGNHLEGAEEVIATAPSPSMWARVVRKPHDYFALPSIFDGNSHTSAKALVSDARNSEMGQVKVLPPESTTMTATATTSAGPAWLNKSQRVVQSARKVLKPAELNVGSPTSPSAPRTPVGVMSGSAASRLPLLPLSPHPTHTESPGIRPTAQSQMSPQQSGEGKVGTSHENKEAVKSNAEQPMPSEVSPPRSRNDRRRSSSKRNDVKDVAAAAVAHASPPSLHTPQVPLKQLSQTPSAASGGETANVGPHIAAGRAAAAASVYPTSTQGVHMPLSSSLRQPRSRLSPALQSAPCTAVSESTKRRYTRVTHPFTEEAVGNERGNAAQSSPAPVTPSKASPSTKQAEHKPVVTHPLARVEETGEEADEKTSLPQQSLSYFGAVPETLSQKPERGKSATSSRVPVVRWVMAGATRPSTATSLSSSSFPRDADVCVTGSRGSGARESSFSLFPAYHVARTTTSPALPAAVPSPPPVKASAELTHLIQRRWAGFGASEDGRERSTSAFDLETQSGGSTSFTQELNKNRKCGVQPLANVKQEADPPFSSLSEDAMKAYSILSFTDWAIASIGGVTEAVTATVAPATKKGSSNYDAKYKEMGDSVQVEGSVINEESGDVMMSTRWRGVTTEASIAVRNDWDSYGTEESDNSNAGGAMGPTGMTASTRSNGSSIGSHDTHKRLLKDCSATANISEKYMLDRQANMMGARTSAVADALWARGETENTVSRAGVYRNDVLLNSSSTTALASAAAAPPLGKPPQKRHTRWELLTSPDVEPQPEPAMHQLSPHVVLKVAGSKSVSSSTGFSVYCSTAASRGWSVGARPVPSAEEPTRLHHQPQLQHGSSSLPSLMNSDSFAFSALEGSAAGIAGGPRRGGEKDVMEESADVLLEKSFSIGSDFADYDQAAVDRYNYESLWSCSEFGSDGSDSDESELNGLLGTGHRSTSAGENACTDSSEKRPRRLLPISAFRHYYIPEDFITESSISATYKVRERRTCRHFAATFVLLDPGCRGCATAAPSKDPFTSEMKADAASNATVSETTVQQHMSLDLKRFCAMSLVVQHPNLIQTFDVFYRDVQDAEQMKNLVYACTSASGDAAQTWEPEIEKPEQSVRSRSTVSLCLPAASAAASAPVHGEASTPASQRSTNVSALPSEGIRSRSSSLHSVEESRHDGTLTRKRPTKASEGGAALKKNCGSTTPQDAGQHGSGNLFRHLLSSFFGSGSSSPSASAVSGNTRRRTSTDARPGKDEKGGDTKQHGDSAASNSGRVHHGNHMEGSLSSAEMNRSGTVPGFQWPAEAAAELARRERRVAELRASRSSEDRAKAAERRARVEHLATLLVKGRVVAVLISELVQDDTVKAPASLWEEAKRNGGLSETQLMAVTRGVAGALAYLHTFRMPRLAIVHGAVEPRNVMCGVNGVVKLVNYACMHWWLSEEESNTNERDRDRASRGLSGTQEPRQRLKGWSYASSVLKTAPDMYDLGCTLLSLSSGMPLGYARHLFFSRTFPVSNPSLQSLLKGLLEEKPAVRMTAEAVLCHPFASALAPTPMSSQGALKD